MERANAQLKAALQTFRRKQQKWNQQRQMMLKTMGMLQEQLNKYKKKYHKRAASEEQTFIFNQTNISSYYPIVMLKNHNWALKHTLRSHLDSVRTLAFHQNTLLSAGDDCCLKLWNKDTLKLTFRRHLGPIYTIASTPQYIFTAGAQGVVRQWNAASLKGEQSPLFEIDLHEQPIWEIIANTKKNLLLTSSSDKSHKLLRTTPEGMQILWSSTLQDTPTCIQYIGQNRFLSGFVQKNMIGVFDLQRGEALWDYKYEAQGDYAQANKVQVSQRQHIIAAAHQDHAIRFYDPNSNRKIKQIVGHSDGVTSIMFRPEGQELISCSHDGNIRFWDLRKYKCISDVGVHMRKYDEGALCLGYSEGTLAVGGADGLVKLLQQEQ